MNLEIYFLKWGITINLIIFSFTEMATDNYVENSFWNFDTLFVPQQHPARDSQDTFFVSSPASSINLPLEYVSKVQQMHMEGGHGSLGYRAPWSIEEAHKNVLRTHTTAVSARMLYALSKEVPLTFLNYSLNFDQLNYSQ